MPFTPTPTDITALDPSNGDSVDTAQSNAINVLSAKYQDSFAWAEYGAGLAESKLAAIVARSDSFDISEFISAATAALSDIPGITPGTIVYTAPDVPTYGDVPAYNAPTVPTFADISYNAPDAAVYAEIDYTAPTVGSLLELPTPSSHTAGDVPSTEVTFDNPDFSNSLASTLQNKLSGDLSTASTGLGSAEAALFARETARQNAARAKAYDEITTQFSSRGFDLPPGALLAKQTEINNESNIRLADSSSQIMVESARLAQAWNQTTVTAATQLTDLLARVFDSKVMRSFEAAKQTVMLSIEGFKATIQEVVANAQLEGQYIGAISNYNESIIKQYTGEIGGETARISAVSELNKSRSTSFLAEVQGATAVVNALAESNKSKAASYTAEIQGAINPITAITEANRAIASAYDAAVHGASADVAAQGERERALATAGDINSRKALGIADITSKFALTQIDAAVRKYLGDVQILQGAAQSATQLCASALNGVSVSSSFGFSANAGASENRNVARHEVSRTASVAYKAADGTPPWDTQ